MISILYRSSLVLALVNKTLATYDVFAVMSLTNARLEDSDNGRGLICHDYSLHATSALITPNRPTMSHCTAHLEIHVRV